MKAGLLCVAGLTALAQAQPHKQHHRHKRQVVSVVTEVDVATEIDYVTATAPNAVVYVDSNGVPMYTSFEGTAPTQVNEAPHTSPAAAVSIYAAPTSSYVPPPPSSSRSVYVPPPAPSSTETSSSDAAPALAPTSYSAASSPASSAAPASSSLSSGAGSISTGHGITYSPYNNDGSCKSQDQVNTDFEGISGYPFVRIYGTDCNQTATVNQAAAAKGIKLFAGLYDITQVESEIQTIIDAGCLDNIDTVAVGNEGVNDGRYTADAVVAAIGQARSQLQAANYKGRVVTVDTFVAMIANPSMCKASDYAAANCHAFFDGSVTAQNAGQFVLQQAQRVSAACGGMNTMITESGWPSQGDPNDQAVPSLQNQQDAIASLKSAFSSNLILFDAFNGYWKQNNAGTFNAEHYWGIYGNAPS